VEKITLKYEWTDGLTDSHEYMVRTDVASTLSSDNGLVIDKVMDEFLDFLQRAGFNEKSVFDWFNTGN
jgi:hypothetical protein